MQIKPKSHLLSDQAVGMGVPSFTFTCPPFDTSSALSDVIQKTSGKGKAVKRISRKKQEELLASIMKNPLKVGCAFITGKKTDRQAKALAAQIFLRTLERTRAERKAAPCWHIAMSGADQLLYKKKKCSLLVITNITGTSTEYRYERVRDLLELYQDIPCIVVGSGMTPLELADRLHYTASRIMYLTSKKDTTSI